MTQHRFEQAADELLSAWNRHQDLRCSGAPFEQRVRARQDLDEARRDVTQHRLRPAA